MGNGAQSTSRGREYDLWERLDVFLQTDPRDAGCDATTETLDVYAELLAAGSTPSERFPGLHAHFLACDLCADALEGLLTALTDATSSDLDLR